MKSVNDETVKIFAIGLQSSKSSTMKQLYLKAANRAFAGESPSSIVVSCSQ